MASEQEFELFFEPYASRAHLTSWQDRQSMGRSSESMLTFGLVTHAALEGILGLLHPTDDDHILDMGSGIGKVVMGSIYLYPNLAMKASGVELLPGLHNMADEILTNFERELLVGARSRVEFLLGDMFDIDLSPYTIIFVNSTCMDEEFLQRTSEHLVAKMAPGARLVSMGRSLQHPQLHLFDAGAWRMSWQVEGGSKTPVHIYRRLSEA